MDISKFKVNLKKAITKNIKNTLDYLGEITSPESVLYDEVILFSDRHNQNNRSLNLGTITVDDYRVEQNRITRGVLDLIDRIDLSNLFDNEGALELKRQKFTNKVNAVKITSIEFKNTEVNHKKAFYMNLIKLSVILMLSGAMAFMIGVDHSGEGMTERKSTYAYLIVLGYFLAIGTLAFLHYRRYLKQNKDWKSIWKEALELTITGKHDSIMDTLFHTLNEFGFKIKKYNIEEGELEGRKWWLGHTRIVSIQKCSTNENVLISLDYLYPSAILMQEGTNKIMLGKLKKKLVQNFEY